METHINEFCDNGICFDDIAEGTFRQGLPRILGNQLMLHNKNETRSVALAVRFLLSVLVFFAKAFAKALNLNSLKTSILWLSELDL